MVPARVRVGIPVRVPGPGSWRYAGRLDPQPDHRMIAATAGQPAGTRSSAAILATHLHSPPAATTRLGLSPSQPGLNGDCARLGRYGRAGQPTRTFDTQPRSASPPATVMICRTRNTGRGHSRNWAVTSGRWRGGSRQRQAGLRRVQAPSARSGRPRGRMPRSPPSGRTRPGSGPTAWSGTTTR